MPLRHVGLLLLVCLAWGGNFLTSALALRELPPFLFTALRLALVAMCLFPFLTLPAKGQSLRLAAVALLNGALHFGLSFWALALAGNLASPAILMQSYVPMATVLAVVFLGERIGWKTAAGIGVSFAGVMVLGFDPVVLEAPKAMWLMLAAAAMIAVGTVLMRGLTGLNALSQQGWSALIGIAPLIVLSALFEGHQWDAVRGASWVAWFGVVYSALVASVVGHGLYFWLIQRHPVSKVTPWLLIAPLIAIGLGVLFHGDVLGPRLLLGGAMVLGGVLVIGLRRPPRARPELDPAPEA